MTRSVRAKGERVEKKFTFVRITSELRARGTQNRIDSEKSRRSFSSMLHGLYEALRVQRLDEKICCGSSRM